MKKRKRIHINPTTFETYQTRCKPRPRLAKPCDRSTCGLPTPSLTGSHLILLKESTSGLDSERSERVSEKKLTLLCPWIFCEPPETWKMVMNESLGSTFFLSNKPVMTLREEPVIDRKVFHRLYAIATQK